MAGKFHRGGIIFTRMADEAGHTAVLRIVVLEFGIIQAGRDRHERFGRGRNGCRGIFGCGIGIRLFAASEKRQARGQQKQPEPQPGIGSEFCRVFVHGVIGPTGRSSATPE